MPKTLHSLDDLPPVCRQHEKSMVATKTRWGRRWQCPVAGCTMASWGGPTSTPADDETRELRSDAHAAFDPLWQSGRHSRVGLYEQLANFMDLPVEKTHIGMFNAAQLAKVFQFVALLDDGKP